MLKMVLFSPAKLWVDQVLKLIFSIFFSGSVGLKKERIIKIEQRPFYVVPLSRQREPSISILHCDLPVSISHSILTLLCFTVLYHDMHNIFKSRNFTAGLESPWILFSFTLALMPL